MEIDEEHPAVRRILGAGGREGLLRELADELSGADLTSLLLAVVAGRAARVSPAEVMAQYRRDRFVAPGEVDARQLATLEARALDVLDDFESVVLAPVVPFGTHGALGAVAQGRVLTTVRLTEVAADPTTALALEAAVRRKALLDESSRKATPVRLVGVGRVTRAQRFSGARAFAHFSLLGLVTAGRDRGRFAFETDSLLEHAAALARVARMWTGLTPQVALTDHSAAHGGAIDVAGQALESLGLEVTVDTHRVGGAGYYPHVCFKLHVPVDPEPVELGDGGIVEWTQPLLSSRKERLMTSGLSLERLAPLGAGGASSARHRAGRANVQLRPLGLDDQSAFVGLHREMAAEGFDFGLHFDPDAEWSRYLDGLEEQRRGEGSAEGRVPATFLVADLDGEVVGRVSIRHELNDFLAHEGGHIGFGVAAAHRGRGVATQILTQSLVITRALGIRRALLVADETNAASQRVIERCGGRFESTITRASGIRARRYWID